MKAGAREGSTEAKAMAMLSQIEGLCTLGLRAGAFWKSSRSWGLATLPTNCWPKRCALMVENPV